MIYLRRSSRPERGKRTTFFIVGLLVVLFGIGYLFPRFYPSVLYPVTSAFWSSESSFVGFFVNAGKIVSSKYSLVKENKDLSNEIAAKDRALLELDSLKSENESLKNIMGRTAKGSYVLGVILTRPPVSPYDTIIIDAGSSDGILPGDKVFAEGDILIGDVSEVYANQSKVDLYSTPGRTTSVLVGTTTVATEATGKGGGNFTVILPSKTPVSEGAVVTIPLIKTHVFGIVQSVTLDSTGSLQTVLFSSPVNLNQLAFVEVDRGQVVATTTRSSLKK